MRARRGIDLRLEIATALAVLAMIIQVALAPLLQQQHAYSAETDYGLSLICGHQRDGATDEPNAPPSSPHLQDCPCCFSGDSHAVLPDPILPSKPLVLLAFGGSAGARDSQVTNVATIADAQLPRAPPGLG